MDIFKYWEQLVTLVVVVAYIVRIEMMSRANKEALQNDTCITSDWVAFRAITETQLEEHRLEIKKLFEFHEKEGPRPFSHSHVAEQREEARRMFAEEEDF